MHCDGASVVMRCNNEGIHSCISCKFCFSSYRTLYYLSSELFHLHNGCLGSFSMQLRFVDMIEIINVSFFQ